MSTFTVSNTLAPLLALSPSGPLQGIYQSLTPTEAMGLSVTCKAARRVFTNEEAQRALINIHFPSIVNHFPFSSRGLFSRMSVGKNYKAEVIRTLSSDDDDSIMLLQMSADETKALSVSFDQTVKHWDLTTGACLQVWSRDQFINELSTNRAFCESWDRTLKLWGCHVTREGFQAYLDDLDLICCMEYSADGTRALSGSLDHTLKLWDQATGTCILTLPSGHEFFITCLQINADGTKALSGSEDQTLKFWDLTTGTCLQTLSGHERPIKCIQMSADGTKAVSGSEDQTLKFWDLTTGACLRTLSGHEYCINNLQLSADETKVLSGCEGNILKLWDLKTGACLMTLSTDYHSLIQCLQISADETKVLVGCENGTLALWSLFPSLPEERVARVARAFFENRAEAKELFLELPRFVQDRITNALYKLHVRRGKIRPYRIDPDYGRKALFKEEGCSSIAKERKKVFADYMERQFLPDVAEYLEECERQNTLSRVAYTESTLFKEALECLDRLPISIKNDVYKALYEIKKKARTLPDKAPSNYGDLAFHEKKRFYSYDPRKNPSYQKCYEAKLLKE